MFGRMCVFMLAIGLSACSPGITKDNLPSIVDHVNSGGGDFIVEDFPGAEITASLDNGDTLVLTVTNFPTGNQIFDLNALRKEMRPIVCDPSNYGTLIEQGGKVRFEIVSNFGRELPSATFARC